MRVLVVLLIVVGLAAAVAHLAGMNTASVELSAIKMPLAVSIPSAIAVMFVWAWRTEGEILESGSVAFCFLLLIWAALFALICIARALLA